MMYPEESTSLDLEQEQKKEDYLVQSNKLIADANSDRDDLPTDVALSALKDDPTLSKEKRKCANRECPGREARILNQTRDTGILQIFICWAKCSRYFIINCSLRPLPMNLVRSCVLDLYDEQSVSTLAFHPLKAVVAIACDVEIFLHSLPGGEFIGKLHTEKPVIGLVLSETALVARTCNQLSIWEYTTLEPLGKLGFSEDKPIIDIVVCPQYNFLCCTKGGKTLFVHDISRPGFKKPSIRLDCKKPITSLAVHPIRPWVASYSEGTIKIWNIETGAPITQTDELHKQKEYQGARGSTYIRGFLSFSGDGTFLILGNERKQTFSFSFCEEDGLALKSSHAPATQTTTSLVSLCHHPRYNFFWTLESNGTLQGFESEKSISSLLVREEGISELEAVEQFCCAPTFRESNWVLASDTPKSLVVHPRYNYAAFTFDRAPRTSPKKFIIYSLFNDSHRHSFLPSLCGARTAPNAFVSGNGPLAENFFYLASDGQIMNYDIRNTSASLARDMGFMLETSGLTPYHVSYSINDELIVLLSKKNLQHPEDNDFMFSVVPALGETSKIRFSHGKDAIFTRFSTESSIISLGGQKNTELSLSSSKIDLQDSVKRFFTSPLGEGWAVIFVTNQHIVYSMNAQEGYRGVTPFHFDMTRKIKLKRYEQVADILWNWYPSKGECSSNERDVSEYLVAIVTTHRILIALPDLTVICSIEAPHQMRTVYFNSIYWVGMTLFYIVQNQVRSLALDGTHHLVCELNSPESVFVSVWNDRIITAHWDLGGELKVCVNSVGLLEPLLRGEIAAVGYCNRPEHLSLDMQHFLLTTYDYKRINVSLIDKLHTKEYYDLAFHLSLPHPGCSVEKKFRDALYCRKLKTALELLESQIPYKPASSSLPLSQHQKNMFTELAVISRRYGQYSITYRCYEVLEDFKMQLQLAASRSDLIRLSDLKNTLIALDQPEHDTIVNACKKAIKSLCSGAVVKPDFQFENITNSFDATPLVIPNMQSEGQEAISASNYILPFSFLDTPLKWTSRAISDHSDSNECPAFTEPPKESPSVHFPSEMDGIISLYLTRVKGIVNHINASEKLVQRPCTKLEPPKRTNISLTRSCYSIPSSLSVLGKNAKIECRASETSLVSESLLSEVSGDSDEEICSDDEKEKLEDDEDAIPEPPIHSEIEPSPIPPRNKFPPPVIIGGPSKPIKLVPLADDDINQYPCASFVRWGHIGNYQRGASLKIQSVRVPPQEYKSSFEWMTSTTHMFEIGMFSSALCYVENAISSLALSTTKHKRKEFKICVYYKLAIRLLTTIKLLDHSGDLLRVAALSRLFASIPLRQIHRVAAIALAADKNLLAKNYGAANRLLKALDQKKAYNGSNIEEALLRCKNEQFVDADSSISSSARPLCCFSSFRVIPEGDEYLFCTFCDAVFALEVKQLDDVCCFCHVGSLLSCQ